MTKLLVSVRSAGEAEIAIVGGADVIDVKEPARGPLGAPDLTVVQQVVRQVRVRVRISVALGELTSDWVLSPASLDGVQFAKFGLAHCSRQPNWPDRWRRAIAELPQGVVAVAVAYADWQSAMSPKPLQVLDIGVKLGCRALLIDTFSKSGATLTDFLAPEALRDLISAAHGLGCECALAGSLSISQVPEIGALGPDYIAVRGAACDGGRKGNLDLACVRRLARMIQNPMTRHAVGA